MSQLFKCRHELKLSAGKTGAKRGNSVPGLVFVPFLPRFQRVRSWNQICLRFDTQFKFELNRLVLVLDILQKGLLSCVMMEWDTLLAAWSCLSTYPTATTYVSTSYIASTNLHPYLNQNLYLPNPHGNPQTQTFCCGGGGGKGFCVQKSWPEMVRILASLFYRGLDGVHPSVGNLQHQQRQQNMSERTYAPRRAITIGALVLTNITSELQNVNLVLTNIKQDIQLSNDCHVHHQSCIHSNF